LYLNFAKKPEVVYVQPTGTITLPTTIPPIVDPTANWKTYEETYKTTPISQSLFSFKFKYPSEWFTEGVPDSRDTYFSIPSYKYPGVLVLNIEPANGKTITQFIKRDSISYELVQKIDSNSFNGVILSDPATMGNSVYLAVIVKGNYFITLTLTSNPPDLGKDPLTLLKQILSTFKFTENSTSNWKTFKSEKLGISLNYPSSWQLYESGQYQGSFVALDNKKCEKADPNCFENEMGGNCPSSPSCEALQVRYNPEVKTVQELFNQNKYYKNIQESIFAGFPAYNSIYTWLSTNGSGGPTIDVQVGEKVYEISYWNKSTDSETQKIISTIKFN
jgi:hypothetical protein